MSRASTTPSHEMLIGACAAHGLDRTGSMEELTRRLGDHLVLQLFAGKKGSRKRPAQQPTSLQSGGQRSAWHAFLKSEAERVKQAGAFHGRVEVLKEVARRWALHKRALAGQAPPMLGVADVSSEASSEAGSSSGGSCAGEAVPTEADGLVEALQEVPAAELHAALAAHGLPVEGEHEANVVALARALVA